MKKMTTNQKLTAAVASLAVALCFVVGGLIGVWAAAQQSVNTIFNVQYSVGQNIAATVSASYQLGMEDTVATAQVVEINSTSFNTTAPEHEDEQSYHQITGGTINLTPKATYVLFTYTFENTGTTNFTATLTDKSKAANVVVTYNGDENTTIVAQGVNETVLNKANVVTITVPAGAELTAKVLVHVNDVNLTSGYYTSTTTNGVLWSLAYTA